MTFVDKVGVTVLEEDDVSSDDPSQFRLIPALGPQEQMRDGRADPLDWSFEGGHYRFTYVLRKRPNAPVK